MKKNILDSIRTGIFTLSMLALAYASVSAASVALPPGAGPLALGGATAAVEGDLAGTVLHDELTPFVIRGGGGVVLFEGVLQNRVVQSTQTGLLHFYYRIRDTKSGLNGIIKQVKTYGFQYALNLAADWRPDGLGTVYPFQVLRSASSGASVSFDFPPRGRMVLVGGTESKFIYLKTPAKRFLVNGRTMIQLVTGQVATLKTATPVL